MNTDECIRNTISEYNDISYRIDDIFFDSVLEADVDIDDDTNKENFAKKLASKVEKILKELFAIIDRFIENAKNTFMRFAQTDTGFKDHCRRAMVKNKPLEAVKLIAYDYDNAYLENQMTKMTKECTTLLTQLKSEYQKKTEENKDNPLLYNKNDLEAYILLKIGCSKEVSNMTLYFEEVKKNFRVAKKELLFKASSGRDYYNIATGVDKMKSIVTQKQTILKNQAGVIKSELWNIIHSKETQNDIKQQALKVYGNASNIYNIYTAFLKIYVQFNIERALSYRAVLKKLWHFT